MTHPFPRFRTIRGDDLDKMLGTIREDEHLVSHSMIRPRMDASTAHVIIVERRRRAEPLTD